MLPGVFQQLDHARSADASQAACAVGKAPLQRLGRLPAHAVVEARRALEASARHTLPEQLRYESERQRELIDRPEFAEGVAAFLQKRAPVFPGR